MFCDIHSQSMLIIFFLGSILFWEDVAAISGDNVRKASACEFPYVVSIGRRNPERTAQENHFCTGILISREYVLTAAHCVENQVLGNVQITFGIIDLAENTRPDRTRDVQSWMTYNDWAAITDKPLEFPINDIAIMSLSHPVMDRRIEPVHLSPLNNKQIEGSQGIIAGFGTIDGVRASRYLTAANVQILSSDECAEKIRKYTTLYDALPEKSLCSYSEPYARTTAGDSGGPLLNKPRELVGINLGPGPNFSWYKGDKAEELLAKHRIDSHASADYYRDFIEYFI